MEDDFFEDAPGKVAPMTESENAGDGEEKGDQMTYLINREAYPDAKPGDVFKMRVVNVHDKEMECSVEKDDEHEDGEDGEMAAAPMPETPGMMD